TVKDSSQQSQWRTPMYSRAFIRDHDTTTRGGAVAATVHTVLLGSPPQKACYEGDPVRCPTCNSTGYTKCVPPFRPYTGPDGRQINLEGDLCVCKCSPLPRLVASDRNRTMDFGGDEVTSMAGAEGWLAHLRFSEKTDFHDEQF